jgi:CRISPR-associated endonuclease/helicase Cas3
VREHVAAIIGRLRAQDGAEVDMQAWLIQPDGQVEIRSLAELADKDAESDLHGRTLLLPPSAGGLAQGGILDGRAEPAGDGSEDVGDVAGVRCRVFQPGAYPGDGLGSHRVVRVIDFQRDAEEDAADPRRYWLWLEKPEEVDQGRFQCPGRSELLEDHTRAVEAHAAAMVQKLGLPEALARCVVLAARLHDAGKKRRQWQRGIGNEDPGRFLAKAGPELRPRFSDEPYRHEFGSLLDAERDAAFKALDPHGQDLVLHLIAAHHGRARPVFPAEEVHDPDESHRKCEEVGLEVPLRFARLQRQHGRWGLAYLESVLRAADYAASAGRLPAAPAPH